MDGPVIDDPQVMPAADVMARALLAREAAYEGILVVAVTTTRVVCRSTCSAGRPRLKDVATVR